jgi:hypothetical protein
VKIGLRTFLRANNQVQAEWNLLPRQPERFADDPLPPVPLCCVTDNHPNA